MKEERRALEKQLADSAKEAARLNLVWGPSGNISHRMDASSFLISSSGLHLDELKRTDFVRIDLKTNKAEEKKRPSMEFRMHAAVYKARPDVKAILHSQPFFTTLLSCTKLQIKPNLFPESMAYLRCVKRVSYNHPGSYELARDAGKKAKRCNALVLDNHSALCCGVDLKDVLLRTQTLEILCRMLVFSHITHLKLEFLPGHVKKDFLKHLNQISRHRV